MADIFPDVFSYINFVKKERRQVTKRSQRSPATLIDEGTNQSNGLDEHGNTANDNGGNQLVTASYVTELLTLSKTSSMNLATWAYDDTLLSVFDSIRKLYKLDSRISRSQKELKRKSAEKDTADAEINCKVVDSSTITIQLIREKYPVSPTEAIFCDTVGAVNILRIIHSRGEELNDEKYLSWLLMALICIDEVDMKTGAVSACIESIRRCILKKVDDNSTSCDCFDEKIAKSNNSIVWMSILKFIQHIMRVI